MDRRTLIAAAFAASLGASGDALAGPVTDETALAAAAERLRRTMIDVDPAVLKELFSDKLTYGHSDGRVQTKDEVVASLVEKRSVFHTIQISRQTLSLSGDVGIIRNRFEADGASNGKPSKPDLAVLQVWQRQDGRWRLLARQALAYVERS